MLQRQSARRLARTSGRRALGIGFLAVLVFFGWLTYAFFTKAFTPTADVTLQTTHVGLQLGEHADVKLRGLIVGEVRGVGTTGDGARVDLALDPDTIDVIPSNVSARILPKTLFGEKYVELVVPPARSPQALAAGDVIERDRSSVGTELETVLDDVYPLLRTIRPAQLNATLSAMADALEGRGDRVGDNLVRLNDYLAELNPHVPTLTHDVSALADVSDVYADATPDLMRLLANTTKTGNTVVLKQRALEDFLTDLATTSATTRSFLAENEEALIQVGEVSRPTLELLETYSPEYGCLLQGMADWVPTFEDAFGGGEHYEGSAPALHITLEIVPQKRGYSREDKPVFGDDRGPGCHLLPHPPYDQDNPAADVPVDDGVGAQPGPGSRAPLFGVGTAGAGSAAEQRVVNALVGPVLETEPSQVPDIATLLFGPMARGTQVSVR